MPSRLCPSPYPSSGRQSPSTIPHKCQSIYFMLSFKSCFTSQSGQHLPRPHNATPPTVPRLGAPARLWTVTTMTVSLSPHSRCLFRREMSFDRSHQSVSLGVDGGVYSPTPDPLLNWTSSSFDLWNSFWDFFRFSRWMLLILAVFPGKLQPPSRCPFDSGYIYIYNFFW